MTRREISKLAKSKILEGKTRTEVFNEIKAETNEKNELIAKIVRFIPSLAARKKYSTLNTVLGVLICIVGAMKILAVLPMLGQFSNGAVLAFALIVPILNVILAIAVFRYVGSIYQMVALLTVTSTLRSIQNMGDLDAFIIVDIVLIVALITISLILHNKMMPNYEVKKKKVTKPDGKVVVKSVFEFPEPILPSEELDSAI